MRVREAFGAAWDALLANRLRSGLTMLGVIIGVAAVVILVAIGSGAKREVEQQVQGLGSNLILVVPGEFSFGTTPTLSRLTLADVDYVGRIVGDRSAVATTLSSGEDVRVGANDVFVTVNGTNENVPNVLDRPLARGRFLSRADVDTRRRVAVLGSDVAAELFGDVEPLGRQVSIAGVRFRVIGVFASQGSTFGVSRDKEISIPVTAAQRLFGVDRIDGLAVKAPTIDSIPSLQSRIVSGLEQKYPGEKFSAVTQTQILGTIGTILSLLTLVLAAIAAISLLVGGVGVSNIMLVSRPGADPGDRAAQGARGQAARHHRAVPHRGGAAHHRGRWPRDGAGRRRRAAGRRLLAAARGRRLVVAAAGLRGVGRCRGVLRCRPGSPGRPAGPGRRAAQRVSTVAAGRAGAAGSVRL